MFPPTPLPPGLALRVEMFQQFPVWGLSMMHIGPLPKALLDSIAEDSLNILAIWGNSELKNTQNSMEEFQTDIEATHTDRTGLP